MIVLFLFFFSLFASASQAATLYVDGQLAASCTTANYSLVARACTSCGPTNGRGFTTPAAALAASVAGDTIVVRSGTYLLAATLFPKANQTWQTYNAETVTISGNNGVAGRAFQISNVSGVTLDGFTIRGTGFQGVWATVAVNGGLCTNTTVKNMNIADWDWQNQNFYAAIKYSRCRGGLIDNNTIGNPKHGVSDGQLSNGGVDMGGDCGQLDGGGTTISNNTITGSQIGQGIRLDVCAGHPSTPGGRHHITGNTVTNTRLGLHDEAGSSGVFDFNTVTNSGVLAFENRSRGGTAGSANIGVEVLNNTFDRAGWNIVRFIASDVGSLCLNCKFNANHLISVTPTDAALMVEQTTSDSNTFEVNTNAFTVSGTGHNAICWGADDTVNSLTCATGTLYTDAQLATFNSATGNTGNVSAP